MFQGKFDNLDRKMDFYLITSASTFPYFHINWSISSSTKYTLEEVKDIIS